MWFVYNALSLSVSPVRKFSIRSGPYMGDFRKIAIISKNRVPTQKNIFVDISQKRIRSIFKFMEDFLIFIKSWFRNPNSDKYILKLNTYNSRSQPDYTVRILIFWVWIIYSPGWIDPAIDSNDKPFSLSQTIKSI